ncbi:PREDICTED: olfactory receptor 52E4-like isoform X3 [Cyprinodon variegatus]|uniref:olfactory receptor 52E4-like isoform X3 n=1 Tax=Cyprinodon variegatus TaxID=28743 RepID=UPI000742708E|nr:PREDICTED: olfactory receptor 52E4-like isoform X3 [Cyprinodon variegatus]
MIWRAVLLWMENQTTPLKQPIVFELEGINVQPGTGTFLFLLALLAYIVVLLGNGVVICVIMTDRNLHRPMFVIICHLMVCDLLGATMVLPRLMMNLLMGIKKIAYIPAIAQAFCAHTYGAAMLTILSVMAYDRTINQLYCSNRDILNLACIPTPISDIYGLAMTWSLSTVTFILIAFSYIRILSVAIKQGRTDTSLRIKAFQTCAPHIVVYVLFQIASLIVIVSYRFPSLSQNIKKFFSILIFIIPPIMNPIVYGLVSKDLRVSFIKHFSNRLTTLPSRAVAGVIR